MVEAVKILSGSNPARRVLVVRRPDGFYALRPQYHYRNVWEGTLVAEGWAPLPEPSSLYETALLAEREAFAEFPWLRHPGAR
ncbi:hypothetical protein [Nitrospirillum amazonense]|uniref:Uncharacterized protein n=1 Tax=Nitrospirillum amazonense TaxID=28077 RepID=A0A560K9Z0_9PROT|nr:hypothetical protein [Nitrospirillum amazonense]MDG3441659.1 hypothetical protein [Nitrospirillum amazonense]TWB79849.1 hypothetical protein FBZ87_102271 [Nitrospirillum amazonense]